MAIMDLQVVRAPVQARVLASPSVATRKQQIVKLAQAFKKQPNPKAPQIRKISKAIDLPVEDVKSWFANRRMLQAQIEEPAASSSAPPPRPLDMPVAPGPTSPAGILPIEELDVGIDVSLGAGLVDDAMLEMHEFNFSWGEAEGADDSVTATGEPELVSNSSSSFASSASASDDEGVVGVGIPDEW